MLKYFKNFIARGNVIDLAVAVIIGAAFTKVITSFADGIISPVIGLVTGGIDFKDKYINLSGQDVTGLTVEQIRERGLAVIQYGNLITDIINFLIVALVVFLIARSAAKYFRSLEPEPEAMTKSEDLLEQIRDILQTKKI